ncbi:hypothetical protein HQ865_04140 [Mucilaginibacter mali]|uniref:MG2 domain-containing protein n=1 Tax=Mucilaginibacter mali TaxID=2740462 RepID=A0A7D4TTF7_9SPHI|nr:hypothetical protein [Mucilaginibacter mali]QKJ28975.1 hypothetical protein HQ865_04140 [Mucilaginibacter mali]
MMFKLAMRMAILILLTIGNMVVRAQGNNPMVDSILKHAAYYHVKNPVSLMFVHLDKTVYVNNDMMWFTAYLLGVKAHEAAGHQVLSAALVNNNDQKIAVQGRFVMSRGLAYGNMMIPDSVPPGHYSFVAYTNRMLNGKPQVCFVQAITLKTVTEPNFNVELALDTMYHDPANMRVLLKADSRSTPLDGASVSYFLGKNAKTRVAGKAKTNVIGSYTIMLPRDRINATQHNLEVQVKSGADVKTLHLDIPVKRPAVAIGFYPEGGHLIENIVSRVGWEVKTPGGTAIKTDAVLYINGNPADTIHTDSFGMGVFSINPQVNATYAVKLLDNDYDTELHPLPAALKAGVVVRVADAIINDSLRLQLRAQQVGRVTLLVHNYRQVYSATPLTVSQAARGVKVDMSAIPRGISCITVLDSLNRPCAERLFFAHYNQRPRLSINIDNTDPLLRQKVSVKLKLNENNGHPQQGIVSVACVQDSRFEVKNDNNIENYVYLQSEIDDLPVKERLMGSAELDLQYLNELLLIRGWSKYKWLDMMKTSEADTIIRNDSLFYAGTITHFGNKLKKPVEVLLMKDSSAMNMIASTATGGFTLANNQLYTPADKKVHLIVSGSSSDYLIDVADPYPDRNKQLAKDIEPVMFEPPIVQSTKELVLKGFEHTTHLKEVVIKSSNSRNFKHGFAVNANACGDYVCPYHILNCPNHTSDPGNHAPQQGEMVHMGGQGLTPYYGCSDEVPKGGMLIFQGIYAAREFYGADYAKINPTEPDYLSTICWKHGVGISSEKETEISFYTSDITGKFRIVVQGITNSDVVYGEDSFTVRKKSP